MIDILTTSAKIRSLLFFIRALFAKVSPKYRELCMETPCLCPSEGQKYGGHKVTETPVTDICYRNEKSLL